MSYEELLIYTIGIFAIIVNSVLITYVYYKLKSRKMDLIEKGLWRSEYEGERVEAILMGGFVLIAMGTAVLLGGFLSEKVEVYFKAIGGLTPLLVGVALTVHYFFCKHSTKKTPEEDKGK